MPRSPAARTVRRSASTPARWPAARGRPRALAQRPLPSMMIAIWAGFTMRFLSGEPLLARRIVPGNAMKSNLQDLRFLLGQQAVDHRDRVVGQLLHPVVLDARVILADVAVLLRLLGDLHAVAADMAGGDLGLLGILVGDLDQLLAALLVQLGQ